MSDQSDSSNDENLNRSSDEDEEPNLDDSNQPSHQPEKPHKLRAKDFIEDTAEDDTEGSDSYEEDYDDDEENEEDKKFVNDDIEDDDTSFTSYLRMDKKRKKKNKAKEKKYKTIKEKSREIQNRFSGYVDRDVYEYIPDQKALKTGILQWRASLVPSVGDNRLFLIHTNPGKEYKVLLNLMKKYYPGGDVSMINQQFATVFAAFCPQPGTGYVYVEAMTSAEVKMFQADIPDVLVYKDVVPIPYSEIPDTIQVSDRRIDIYPGEFVRIRVDHRNESYKGDLAQVININTNNDSVLLKLVPRIDYSQLQAIHDNAQKDDSNDSNAVSLDEKVAGLQSNLNRLKGLKKYRPPQADFKESMIISFSVDNKPIRGKIKHWKIKFDDPNYTIPFAVFEWDGAYYIGPFAYKEYPINHIIHENVNPRQDEIKRFVDGLESTEFESHIPGFKDQMNISIGRPTSNNFNIHNIVRIIEGEYKGLIVEITSINNDNVTVIPVDKEYGDVEITINVDMIQKFFAEGDHVKILSGKYEGLTGEVQITEDDYAYILLDSNSQTEKINMSQLVSSSDVFSEPATIGKYSRGDLVQLNDKLEGVIWRIDNAMMISVLLANGDSRENISLDNIDHKINDRNRTTRDEKNKIINIGQMVTLKQGGKALVKHISQNIVFLQDESNRSNRKYNGIFIAEARSCQVNSNLKKPISQPRVYNGSTKFHSLTNTEYKIGQTIIIKTGKMKGQLGNIKEIDNISIRVLFHLKNNFKNLLFSDRGKTWDIFVKKDKSDFDSIFAKGTNKNTNNNNYNNQTNNYPNQNNSYYSAYQYQPQNNGSQNNYNPPQNYPNYRYGYGQDSYPQQNYGYGSANGYPSQQRYN